MSKIWRGSAMTTGRIAATTLAAAGCAAGAGPAMAGLNTGFSVGATVGVEYNSNAFNLGDAELPPGSGDTKRDDLTRRASIDFRFNVGVDEANSGPFRLQVRAGLIDASFDHFHTISHRDHDVGATLDWRPSQMFDMSLDTSHSSDPVEIADTGGTESSQQRTFRNTATLRLRPTPQWQIAVTPGWSKSTTDLPNAPDFQLRENSGKVALDFLGAGRLVPGIAFTQSKGRYSGIDTPTRYRDDTVQATLNYNATAASTFSFAAGQTKRSTHLLEPSTDPDDLELEGSNSAFTGSLNFHRQLSVKTGLDIGAYRYFTRYGAGVNTAVGTGFNSGITWAATSKISATLDADLIWLAIDDIQVDDTFVRRKDLERRLSLGLTYAFTQRFSLRGYLARSVRTSDVDSAEFRNTVAGVDLSANLF
jgi:hypothetical protein